MGESIKMTAMFTNVDPSEGQIVSNLLIAHEVALKALQEGRHPFGAVLVAPDHKTVLMEQGNIDTVNHAESTIARRAAEAYDPDFLWNCTLYTTLEPCAMCSGTIYWANIGRVVYAATEADLLDLTGNHDENPTMDLPCRSVFSAGQKPIKIWGPIESIKGEILAPHISFWQSHE